MTLADDTALRARWREPTSYWKLWRDQVGRDRADPCPGPGLRARPAAAFPARFVSVPTPRIDCAQSAGLPPDKEKTHGKHGEDAGGVASRGPAVRALTGVPGGCERERSGDLRACGRGPGGVLGGVGLEAGVVLALAAGAGLDAAPREVVRGREAERCVQLPGPASDLRPSDESGGYMGGRAGRRTYLYVLVPDLLG